jgi:hypothetical protein
MGHLANGCRQRAGEAIHCCSAEGVDRGQSLRASHIDRVKVPEIFKMTGLEGLTFMKSLSGWASDTSPDAVMRSRCRERLCRASLLAARSWRVRPPRREALRRAHHPPLPHGATASPGAHQTGSRHDYEQ